MPEDGATFLGRLVGPLRPTPSRIDDPLEARDAPRAEDIPSLTGRIEEERYLSELMAAVDSALSLPTSPPETKSRYGELIAPRPDWHGDDRLTLWGDPIEVEFRRLSMEKWPLGMWEVALLLATALEMELSQPGSDPDERFLRSLALFIQLAWCWRTAELHVFDSDPADRVQADVLDSLPRRGEDAVHVLYEAVSATLGRGIAFEYGVMSGSLGPDLTRLGMTRVALRHYEITSASLPDIIRWQAFTCGLALRHAELAFQAQPPVVNR